jgi:NitT/TauT family transport system permease protein
VSSGPYPPGATDWRPGRVGQNMRRRLLRWLRANGLAVAVYLALLLAWEGANRVLHVPAYLVPPPSSVAQRLAENPGRLLTHSLTTLQEVLGGFALGVAVSLPLALLISTSRLLGRLVYPLLVAFQAVPKVALAPIVVVWFGFGPTSKVMLGFVTAMFPMVVNTVIGLEQTPPELLYLMRSMGASPWQTFAKVRLFTAAPYVFGGFKVGITLAVVGAVVGEFIASNSGLGYLLLVANNSFNTPLLFAVVALLSLLSVVLFYLVEAVEALVLPRPLRRKRADAAWGGGG